jgi:hypothetical protein
MNTNNESNNNTQNQGDTDTTGILFSTKDDQSLTFKKIKTISHNDGLQIPVLYYDNETYSILNQESDHKLLFRFCAIIMVILIFFLTIDVVINYVQLS